LNDDLSRLLLLLFRLRNVHGQHAILAFTTNRIGDNVIWQREAAAEVCIIRSSKPERDSQMYLVTFDLTRVSSRRASPARCTLPIRRVRSCSGSGLLSGTTSTRQTAKSKARDRVDRSSRTAAGKAHLYVLGNRRDTDDTPGSRFGL
jgi:hypothetical protein